MAAATGSHILLGPRDEVSRAPVLSGMSTFCSSALLLILILDHQSNLLQVQLQQEARDMWRVFLEQRDWEAALRQCSSNAQRDEVHRARAEAAAAARDWSTAAVHWAKVGGQTYSGAVVAAFPVQHVLLHDYLTEVLVQCTGRRRVTDSGAAYVRENNAHAQQMEEQEGRAGVHTSVLY
jgi:hypothetical protein